MVEPHELFQEHAVLAHRVGQLERKMDKIDAVQDTIQIQVSQIKDAIEAMEKESQRSRHESERKLQCFIEAWREHTKTYGPVLADIVEKRGEAKDLRKKLVAAWFVLGAGALWQWGEKFFDFIFRRGP